jgi:hypothetical protein
VAFTLISLDLYGSTIIALIDETNSRASHKYLSGCFLWVLRQEGITLGGDVQSSIDNANSFVHILFPISVGRDSVDSEEIVTLYRAEE